MLYDDMDTNFRTLFREQFNKIIKLKFKKTWSYPPKKNILHHKALCNKGHSSSDKQLSGRDEG